MKVSDFPSIFFFKNIHLKLGLSCPVCVWGPPGLLATGSCYWVGWRLRSMNAAFTCWSFLSYNYYIVNDVLPDIKLYLNMKYFLSFFSTVKSFWFHTIIVNSRNNISMLETNTRKSENKRQHLFDNHTTKAIQ
jgi:hypothetical protein